MVDQKPGVVDQVRSLLEGGQERIVRPAHSGIRAAVAYPRRLTDGGGPAAILSDDGDEDYAYPLPSAIADIPIVETLEYVPQGVTVINNSYQTVRLDLGPKSQVLALIRQNAIAVMPAMSWLRLPWPNGLARQRQFALVIDPCEGVAPNTALPGKVTVLAHRQPVGPGAGSLLANGETFMFAVEMDIAAGTTVQEGFGAAAVSAANNFVALGFEISSVGPAAGGGPTALNFQLSQDPQAFINVPTAQFIAPWITVTAGGSRSIPFVCTGYQVKNPTAATGRFSVVTTGVLLP